MSVTIDVGTPGNPGLSAYQVWLAAGNTGTQAQFLASLIGVQGLSAFQVWQAQPGNSAGTVAQFLASLVGAQGVPGANARYVPGTSYTGLVGTRCRVNADKVAGMYSNSRTVHYSPVALSSLSVGVPNWLVDYSGSPFGEKPLGSDSNLRVSVEYNNSIVQCTIGGATTGRGYDFTTTQTDNNALGFTIPANTPFYIHINRVLLTSGGIGIPVGNTGGILMNAAAGDCFEYSASALPDRTGTPGAFTSTGTAWARPVFIAGTTNVRSIGCTGDSRVAGLNDDGAGSLYIGEQERAINGTYGFTNLAVIGETITGANGVLTLGYEQRAAILRKYCTDIICNYQINDVIANATVQAISQNIEKFRQMFPAQRVFWTTAMGLAVGTPYTTIGAQSNNWLLTEVPSLDGAFDVATALSTGRNTITYANPAWVGGDGIHETKAGYIQAATAIVLPA